MTSRSHDVQPLSHLTEVGEAHMVDIGAKAPSRRTAIARATVSMGRQTAARLAEGDLPKGDVSAAARIAGIMAAKHTSTLIPLCHPISLTRVAVDISVAEAAVTIDCVTEATDRTGVEMEAMVGASVAALTFYDMLKGVDRTITYTVSLLEKTGGSGDDFRRST